MASIDGISIDVRPVSRYHGPIQAHSRYSSRPNNGGQFFRVWEGFLSQRARIYDRCRISFRRYSDFSLRCLILGISIMMDLSAKESRIKCPVAHILEPRSSMLSRQSNCLLKGQIRQHSSGRLLVCCAMSRYTKLILVGRDIKYRYRLADHGCVESRRSCTVSQIALTSSTYLATVGISRAETLYHSWSPDSPQKEHYETSSKVTTFLFAINCSSAKMLPKACTHYTLPALHMGT